MVQSANEELLSLQIRHAVDLLKYGNGVERDILKLLVSSETKLLAEVAGRLGTIEERGFDIGPKVTERLNKQLEAIRALINGVYSKAYDQLVSELEGLAINEAEFQTKALNRVITVDIAAVAPAPALLRSIVTERPIMGQLLKSFMNGASVGAANRVEQVIREGMYSGKTIDQMVSGIRGTKAGGYKNGVLERNRTSARGVVRTSVNHVSNAAAQATWHRNSNLVKGWQFHATLDSRTTKICGSLDGKVFPIGEGPVPPRHPNCRSITTAVTKSFKELGLDKADYTPDQRASMDGQVKAPVTFGDWLKGRSLATQDQVLGKTRADLWRKGKLSLDDFVRDGREVITLDELKKLHPEAFS